jgi:uroporphyrin-3 C-methyltransferase
MTDIKSDDIKAAPAPIATTRPPKSGRGLAGFALLIALAAALGGGYLWYLWQQDQASQASRLSTAIKQATAPRDAELQSIKTQIQQLQELQALKPSLEQTRTTITGLAGTVQPLKDALELQKGENTVLKDQMKLLRENQDLDKAEIKKQKQELAQDLAQQQGLLAKLGEQSKNLQLTTNGLAEQLNILKIAVTKGGDINAFPLAEVDYLLRLADTKLRIEHNVPSALVALQTAQQRLKSVDESALAPIQTMIGEAIGHLSGVKLPEVSGLAHKLVEMEKQVKSLPIKINSEVPDIKNKIKPGTNVTISDDQEQPWWDRTGEAVWNQFKSIVVIRRVRSDGPPLIGVEEEFFLRQNLQLTLESMRAALLRGDVQSYQDSLELINTWLGSYFDPQDSHVTAFASELKALKTIDFNPYIPDLTGLNKAFQEVMSQRQPIRAVQKAAVTTEPTTTGREVHP